MQTITIRHHLFGTRYWNRTSATIVSGWDSTTKLSGHIWYSVGESNPCSQIESLLSSR
jgi:hypothetical protein